IFDSTQDAQEPNHSLPALNALGSELNALVASGVPAKNARFVVVFHGSAIKGILKNEAYRAKFGVDNPNLAVLSKLKARALSSLCVARTWRSTALTPTALLRMLLLQATLLSS
ncbi:MAG TPA: hypothetical protein VGQ93_05565, partial [Lysobacter sp.]|nr:hypothetical protein [Lysobacter sp.]